MFPFASITTSDGPYKLTAGNAPWTKRSQFLDEVTKWEAIAKSRTDVNSVTLLKPGNLDVVQDRFVRWQPRPLIAFFDDGRLVACAVLQEKVPTVDNGLYVCIGALVVNPAMHGQGYGTAFVRALCDTHRKDFKGFVLFSEKASQGFWAKVGFKPFECEQLCTDVDDLTLMKLDF